jgi:hypothetical protein
LTSVQNIVFVTTSAHERARSAEHGSEVDHLAEI